MTPPPSSAVCAVQTGSFTAASTSLSLIGAASGTTRLRKALSAIAAEVAEHPQFVDCGE